MNSNEVWARCADCGTELKQSDKQCPKCNSTRKSYEEKASVKIGVSVGGKVVHKRKGVRRPLAEMIFNRWKPSVNPELKNGVREDMAIDREKDEYHQVVRDAKTGEVTHEEHQRLSEHNKQGKNRKGILRKLGKWGIGAIGVIIVTLICSLIWFLILPLLQQPLEPNIISSTNPNPIINTSSTASVVVTATPDFKPPYVNFIVETIPNDNPYKCYMVLEFKASEGFKFLPLSENLPDNFRVEEGYEYQDVMKVYIKDFPPRFTYYLTLSVYTLNPDTYGRTEKISWRVFEVRHED